MVNGIPSGEKADKSKARRLMIRVHPDALKSNEGAPLIALLEKISNNPFDMDNWGDDVNAQYPTKGSQITLIGTAKDGTPRPPRAVTLKSPGIFLKMLEAYLDTGEIPQHLLDAPDNDPSVMDDDDDEPNPQAFVSEASRSLLNGISLASDFERCLGLLTATKFHSRETMRNAGILKALDEKTAAIITAEIAAIDSDEKSKEVEEHIKEFEFADNTIKTQLVHALRERRNNADWRAEAGTQPNEYEIRAAGATTLDELADYMKATEVGTFASPEEKSRALRSINGYAKKIIMDESSTTGTIADLSRIYERAQRFPFTDDDYGYHVLGMIEMRAKYLLYGQILATTSNSELEKLGNEINEFRFWTTENKDDLWSEIERRQQFLHRNQIK